MADKESWKLRGAATFDIEDYARIYPAENLVPQGKTATQYFTSSGISGYALSALAEDGKTGFAIKRIIAKELKLIRRAVWATFFNHYDIVQFANYNTFCYQSRGPLLAISVVCYLLRNYRGWSTFR